MDFKQSYVLAEKTQTCTKAGNLQKTQAPGKMEGSENIAYTLQKMQPEDMFFEGEVASREMSWSLNILFPLGGSMWRGGGCSKHARPALCLAIDPKQKHNNLKLL